MSKTELEQAMAESDDKTINSLFKELGDIKGKLSGIETTLSNIPCRENTGKINALSAWQQHHDGEENGKRQVSQSASSSQTLNLRKYAFYFGVIFGMIQVAGLIVSWIIAKG